MVTYNTGTKCLSVHQDMRQLTWPRASPTGCAKSCSLILSYASRQP